MTIVSYLQSVATILGLRFYHGEAAFQNIRADEDVFPVMYLDDPIKSEETGASYVISKYPVRIMFADKTTMDWDTTKHQIVIDAMRTQCRKFLLTMQKDDLVQGLDTATITDFINLFDANLSGCILELRISLFNNLSNCLP